MIVDVLIGFTIAPSFTANATPICSVVRRAMRVRELTLEEAWLYMPKSLKALIRFLGMLLTSVVIVLCAI